MKLAVSVAVCVLLALALASQPLQSSRGIVLAEAGPLEDLLAEGVDMLSGRGARDSANQQLRSARQKARNPEQCSVFRCPHPDHEAQPREGHVATSNGCGSYGFKIHSKWHESCCDRHDKCYSTCNKSRDYCDKKFKECMQSRCKTFADQKKYAKEKEDCEGQASMFFTATRTLGCQTYLESQKEACTCTLAEKAKKAIKDGATKVKQAAKAAGDAVKEAVHGAPAEGVSAEQQKHASEQQQQKKKKKQPATQKPQRAQPQPPPIRDDKDEL